MYQATQTEIRLNLKWRFWNYWVDFVGFIELSFVSFPAKFMEINKIALRQVAKAKPNSIQQKQVKAIS